MSHPTQSGWKKKVQLTEKFYLDDHNLNFPIIKMSQWVKDEFPKVVNKDMWMMCWFEYDIFDLHMQHSGHAASVSLGIFYGGGFISSDHVSNMAAGDDESDKHLQYL